MSYERNAELVFVRRLREPWEAMIALHSLRLAYPSERHVRYHKAYSLVVEHALSSHNITWKYLVIAGQSPHVTETLVQRSQRTMRKMAQKVSTDAER